MGFAHGACTKEEADLCVKDLAGQRGKTLTAINQCSECDNV